MCVRTAANLSADVSSVDDQVSTGHVRAGVTAEVDISSLELLCVTVAAHWDHGEPEVLDLLVDEVGEAGVDIAGRDAVDTGKVTPFVGQGASHVDAAGFGDVVGGLLLGEVGDVAGHGGGDDEAAGASLLEVGAYGLCTVECAIEIGLDDLVPGLDGALEDAAVGGAAGVGNEGIDLAKVLDYGLDKVVDVFPVTDVALVCLALDTVLLLEFFGVLLTTLGARRVGDGNVCSHLSTSTGSLNAHASGSRGAGDDDDLALEAEHILKALGLWNWDRHDGGWDWLN